MSGFRRPGKRRRNALKLGPVTPRFLPKTSYQLATGNGQANGGGMPPKALSPLCRAILSLVSQQPQANREIAAQLPPRLRGANPSQVAGAIKQLSQRRLVTRVARGWVLDPLGGEQDAA